MRTWYKLPSNKVHATDGRKGIYGDMLYLCGVAHSSSDDLRYSKKPKNAIFCKNCLKKISK